MLALLSRGQGTGPFPPLLGPAGAVGLAVPGAWALVCSGRPEGAVPALHTQLALFWGQREGTGGGQLSWEPEPGGWGRQGAPGPGCLAGTALEALGFTAAALLLSIWLAGPFWVNGTDSRGGKGEALRTPVGQAAPSFFSGPRHLR